MAYKVEQDWEYKGLRCVVVMTDIGHRCGYVGVDKDHPLYKVDYQSHCAFLKSRWEEAKTGAIGGRGIIPLVCWDGETVSPEIVFDVHGGITYSRGAIDYPVDSDLWWFGYDCAHAGDAKDLNAIEDKEIRNKQSIKQIYERYHIAGDVVRSLGYCIEQCEKLADQLNEVKEV